MKFATNSQELQKVLSRVIGVVPTKTTIPILENVLFELKEKYLLLEKQLEEINKEDEEKEIKIPLSIFSSKLGSLEVLCIYLKENVGMSYREIGKILMRDERTIWAAYHKARKKSNENLVVREGSNIPLEVFNNSILTIQEAVIIYLREKNLRYAEIAEILMRDQRNVRNSYNKALIKNK